MPLSMYHYQSRPTRVPIEVWIVLDSSHSQIALNDSQIIMKLTADVEVKRSLEARARGYLRKNMPPRELANVIRQVHAGKKRLPPEIT